MDIHRPKAAHSIREFLIEIGTIICGILIALGLEQGIEWLHWNHTVEVAREGLREEMAFDDGFLRIRLTIAPCVERRLAALDKVIAEATVTGRIGEVEKGNFNLSGQLDYNQWTSERSSQSLTHFPHAELTELNRYYSVIETYKQRWLANEDDDWIGLSGLQTGPRQISSEELAQMRYRLQSARWIERTLLITARRNLDISARLGVKPKDRPGNDLASRTCGGVTPAVVIN